MRAVRLPTPSWPRHLLYRASALAVKVFIVDAHLSTVRGCGEGVIPTEATSFAGIHLFAIDTSHSLHVPPSTGKVIAEEPHSCLAGHSRNEGVSKQTSCHVAGAHCSSFLPLPRLLIVVAWSFEAEPSP
ncbi:hypothetical protein MRX96_059609 [Rhipicephalus microplus]